MSARESREQTLALPLSGAEVIESVLSKVRRMLQNDCYLSPMTAYEAVAGVIKIELRCRDVGRIAEINASVAIKEGPVDELTDGDDRFLVEETIVEQPPNEVRVESEQPVPTLTEGADGRREIKGIKYARKHEAPKSHQDPVKS